MREFKHPNMSNFECPVCHTKADSPVVLVGIPGTEDGGNIEAVQVHSDCYRAIAKMQGIDVNIEPC